MKYGYLILFAFAFSAPSFANKGPIAVTNVVDCYMEQGDGSPGSSHPQCVVELNAAGVKNIVGTGKSGYFVVASNAEDAAKFGFKGSSWTKAQQDGCIHFKAKMKLNVEVASIEPSSDGNYMGVLKVLQVVSNPGLKLSSEGCD